jgi:SAM-dependent methyltransferase
MCPVCKSNEIDEKVHHWEYFGKSYSISACRNCHSWFYDPFPTPDYMEDLNSDIGLRHYLETYAGIEALVTLAENFYTHYAKGSKRGLEIGCGFGFISHYLKFVYGQEMTAYEPSGYGVKGKELLGLNIIKDYYKSDGQTMYDFCIATEVIEHIEDPVAFAADILKSLSREGRLLLSTPDKDSINMDRMEPIDAALLSPGMHTILFSESSLKRMLSLAGFSHVLVKKNVNTLYAVASREPLRDKPLFTTDFSKLMKYYQHVYEMAPPNSPLQKGLFYRLFRLSMDFGMYKEAVALLKGNSYFYVIAKDEISSIRTEKDLEKFYSLTDSVIYFYCGILYLNYLVNYEKAAHLFQLSFLACSKRLLIVPQFAVVDVDIVWQTKLHEGIANECLGNPIAAAQNYLEILSFKENKDNNPVPGETIVSEARSKLKKLVDAL